MDLTYNYSDIEPQFVTCERNLGRNVYTINFGVVKLTKKEQADGQKYKYHSITLPAGQYDRSTVISAIICQRYTNDEMQAIINNYLLDNTDEEAIQEFNAMQEYRRFAKRTADEFLAVIS